MVLPPATPDAIPDAEPMVATEVVLLVHVPPDGVELYVTLSFEQNTFEPLIAVGVVLTVTTAVRKQDVAVMMYDIVVVPALTPVTIPVPEPMVPTAVLLLDHVPPPVELVKAVIEPAHTDSVPLIAFGKAFTVTTRVA